MSRRQKTYTQEFKLQVVRESEAGVPIAHLTRKYEVGKNSIFKWRAKLRGNPANPFPGKGSRNTDKARIAELERMVGRLTMEVEFLENLNERLEEIERQSTL